MIKKFDTDSLYSGMFSDILDNLGYNNNIILGLNPINKGSKIFGRARTLELIDSPGLPENIDKGLGFIEKIDVDEILFVKGSNKYAYFGELMTRLSMRQKIQGAIIHGLSRDSAFIRNTNFNFFSSGFSPIDIKNRGQVSKVDKRIEINNISIDSGSLIFADNDGVAIIPKKIEENFLKELNITVLEEKEIQNEINKGFSVEKILEKHTSF